MANQSERFVSLATAADGWFDRPLTELPSELRDRVEREFAPRRWDLMKPIERESLAKSWDYENDPARKEKERVSGLALSNEYHHLQHQIAVWEGKRDEDQDASAQKVKDDQLRNLRERFAGVEAQYKRLRGDFASGDVRAKPKSPQPCTRSDALDGEIQNILHTLGPAATPYQVMQALGRVAGREGSSILSSDGNAVVWHSADGEPNKTTIEALRKRLGRKKLKAGSAR